MDHPTISLTFFSLGAFASINNISFPAYGKKYKYLFVIAVLLWISCSFVALNYIDNNFWMNIVRNISIIFGFITIWFLYDFCYKRCEKVFHSRIISFVFFIYLFHEPLLTFIKYGSFYILKGLNPITSFLLYVILPTSVITICYVGGILLKKWLPGLYNLMTGNR